MEKLIRDIDDYSYFAQGNNAGQGRPNGYNGGPNPNGYNGGPNPNGYNGGPNGYSGGPNGYNGGPNGYNGGPNGYNNRNGQNNNNNNNNNKKPKNFSAIIFLIIAGVVTFLGITVLNSMLRSATYKEISYSEFITMVNEGKIEKVKFDSDRIVITPAEENSDSDKKEVIRYTYYTGYVNDEELTGLLKDCLLYTSPSPRDA